MTLYITSVSFEERCLALVSGLRKAKGEEERILILDFRGYENVDPYLVNRARLVEKVRNLGLEIAFVEVSIAAPLEGEAKLRREVWSCRPNAVVLDISTMPRGYLFSTCRMLCELGLDARIRYYKPSTYGRQLSRGVRRVQPVPGFEGTAGGASSTVLVIILGYEGYKALYAWEHLGASRTVALFGDPPYRAEFLETARRNNGELFKQLGSRAEEGRLNTFDMEVAHGQLVELYKRLRAEDERAGITLCPLGTKPQSVAAFALAYRHRDITVAHVSSLMYYTGDYSRGFERDYVEVSLGKLLGQEAQRSPHSPI